MKALERIVCCCICCEKAKLKLQALNREAMKAGRNDLRINSIEELSKMTLCPAENLCDTKTRCLKRQCTSCIAKAIADHFAPILAVKDNSGNEVIHYDQWGTTIITVPVKSREPNAPPRTRQVKRLVRQ